MPTWNGFRAVVATSTAAFALFYCTIAFGVVEVRPGDARIDLDFHERPYPSRNAMLPLTLPLGTNTAAYTRVATDGEMLFPARRWAEKAFTTARSLSSSTPSALYGASSRGRLQPVHRARRLGRRSTVH